MTAAARTATPPSATLGFDDWTRDRLVRQPAFFFEISSHDPALLLLLQAGARREAV